ncbi:MAG: ATP-binding protein [Deltaproteobacteria bacterium]|nr:ATP-binding protein [Deltaproteobacteria bacterium]
MKDRFLFSVCPESEFFDRTGEIDYILERAGAQTRAPGIFLSGRRWTGKTEVLRRVHSRLFWGQSSVLPVYYQFRDYGGAGGVAEDFLKEVVKQFLAFRRRDPGLVGRELSLDKVESMLIDEEETELSSCVSIHRDARRSGDTVSALRNAAGLPGRISERSGIPVCLILDDIDDGAATLTEEGPGVMGGFMEAVAAGTSSIVASGSTDKVLESGAIGPVESFRLGGLAHGQASSMMMELCRQHGIGFDTEILELAAGKLDGNPMYMKNLIWAARRAGTGLFTLKDLIDLYAKEIFDGNIGLALRSSVRLKGAGELKALHAIASVPGSPASPVSEEELAERFRVPPAALREAIGGLAAEGLVEAGLGSVRWTGDNVARDFVRFNYEVLCRGRSAEEVRTFMVRDGLKEGFSLKGAAVRGRLKEETSGLLGSFNGQKVLKALLDNRAFTAPRSSGVFEAAGQAGVAGSVTGGGKEAGEVTLPQVIGCFDSAVWEKNETGPPVIIANGFQNGRYDAGNEVVWIVAVKDALSPVNMGDVENFLRRSRILRVHFRTTRVFKWFVGKEGFTAEALERLASEGVFTSGPAQMRVLKDSVEDGEAVKKLSAAGKAVPNKEFEVVLPAFAKAELVAARAVEEIGVEMGFGEIAIGQIKAALIEACINAFEHSGVKASKVFLRFVAGDNGLTIHVQNGGVDFDKAPGRGDAAGSGKLKKRGWGFELMKGLMDEVRFEKIHGGAKIVMVKYLKAASKN